MARPQGIVRKAPRKPHKNFPLYAHGCGSWVMKVNGNLKTFGGWKNDPKGEAAILRYEEWKRNGTPATAQRTGPLTIEAVTNLFLDNRHKKYSAGELNAGTYADYRNATDSFARIVGKGTSVYDLTPIDFAKVRDQWANTRKSHALGRWIQAVRTMFRHVGPDGMDVMDRSPRYGGEFKKPLAKLKRRELRISETEGGKRVFSPTEIAGLLSLASPNVKAAILLGLNTGFLAIDCARLKIADVDLDGAFLTFVREKTETARSAVLWPETVTAIRESLKQRPGPAKEAWSDLLFLTAKGFPLVHDKITADEAGDVDKVSRSDSLTQAVNKMKVPLKIKLKGSSFSTLRKTFRTFADEVGDAHAVNLNMGHTFGGMAYHYVRMIIEPRLRKVAAHVHNRALMLCTGFSPMEAEPAVEAVAAAPKTAKPKTHARRRHESGKPPAPQHQR